MPAPAALAERRRDTAPLGTAADYEPSRAELWRTELGARWPIVFGALFGLVFIAGVAAPLADPDLAIHLATGEWIARHRAVPFTEPFAWTRAGEPFYAYSWAIELAYFWVWRAAGPAGLHALHGALLALAVGAMLVLGRVARWRPWTVVLVAAAHLDLTTRIAPFLRPQLVMLIVLPAAWALSLIVWQVPTLRAATARWSLVGLVIAGCVVSNTHLLFPLTAVPAALIFLTAPVRRVGRTVATMAALALGWAISPYTLVWPEVFAQNLGGNLRLAFPSAIVEYMPGFATLGIGTGLVVIGVLTALPWLLPAGDDPATGVPGTTTRERGWYGVAWTVGLVAFAMATRALLVWWIALLPMVARAADRLPPVTPTARRLRTVVLFTLVGVLIAKPVAVAVQAWPAETRVGRGLPTTPAEESVGSLVDCLDRGLRPGTGGRIFTVSDFGGYLAWRLPAYQRSIDGRTIFPDSISRPEVYTHPYAPERPVGPYRAADLAIVPLAFPAAAALDTAAGWRRVATTQPRRWGGIPSGLWVRDAWARGLATRGGLTCDPAESQ